MKMRDLLDRLDEISRRDFLKAAGATVAACGLGGCGIVDDVKEGKRRFRQIKPGMTKNEVLSIMGTDLTNIGPKKTKKSTSYFGTSSEWEYNGVGTLSFINDKVSYIYYADSTFNNYNKDEELEESSNEDIARILELSRDKRA